MKKYSVVLLLVALVGCSKEQIKFNAAKDNRIVLNAQIEQTKVSEDGGHFGWSLGEKVSFASNESEHKGLYEFECIDVNGKFEGTYSGSNLSQIVMAVSPSTACTRYATNNDYDVNLPTSYDYVAGVTNALLIGENASKAYFQFHPVAALIKVTFEHVPAGTRAAKLSVSENITGTVKLESRMNGNTKNGVQIGASGLTGNNVMVKFAENELVGGENITVYFPVPYGTLSNISVVLQKIESENYVDISGTSRTLNGNVTLARTDVFTLPKITLAYTVGATNYSSVFGDNVISEHYAIKPGQVLHMSFINHGKKEALYQNWALELWGSKGNNPWTHFLSIRPDNWDNSVWSTGYSGNCVRSRKTEWIINNSTSETIAWNDATFLNTLDGATVTLDIEYTGKNLVLISATAVNMSEGKTAKMTYYQVINSSTVGNLMANLRCDASYFEIKNVYRTASASTAGLKSDEMFYKYNADLSLSTIGLPKTAYAQMSNGETITIDYSLLAAGTAVIPAAAETGTHSVAGVTFDGQSSSICLKVTKGIGSIGNTSLNANWWEWCENDYRGTLDNVNDTKVITLFVYSSKPDRFSHPYAQLAKSTTAGLNEDYVVARMDNAGFRDATGYPGYDFGTGNTDSNWDWGENFATFTEYQDRATVAITVSRTATDKAKIRFDVTYRDSSTHYQEYRNITIDGIPAYRFSSPNCYSIITSFE